MPGNLTLPTPNAYRSPFRHFDGTYDWRSELEYGFAMIDAQSSGSLAACLVEPILSSGGIIEPHLLTLSKTLGAGLPVAAVVTSEESERVCYEGEFLFFTTHVSDPLAAAVALTVLTVVGRDGLVEQAARLGKQLTERLLDMQDRYGQVGDVRGRGLLQGLELVSDKTSKTLADRLGAGVTAACLERGLHMNIVQLPGMGGIFRIAPPLTISDSELEAGLDILDDALGSVLAR
jgi:2,2-dialkylglycine decarboxylase (pyruvate)